MKIPREVNLSGHPITIKQVWNDENFIGRLETKTLTVELNMHYCDSIIKEALIHELLHAADIIYNLDMNEAQVGVLSAVVHKIIEEEDYVQD